MVSDSASRRSLGHGPDMALALSSFALTALTFRFDIGVSPSTADRYGAKKTPVFFLASPKILYREFPPRAATPTPLDYWIAAGGRKPQFP
jgi:hypothetical protein